jgi:UDP-N-acetylglucosamine:LPS N-acetylglucosamine transferase
MLILLTGVMGSGKTNYLLEKAQATPDYKRLLVKFDLDNNSLIISRSGYSTIMDLAVLGKKAFFIPTPGQFEQEYLAERFQEMGIAPFAKQQNFKLENLYEITKYSGFNSTKTEIDLSLFKLFQSK